MKKTLSTTLMMTIKMTMTTATDCRNKRQIDWSYRRRHTARGQLCFWAALTLHSWVKMTEVEHRTLLFAIAIAFVIWRNVQSALQFPSNGKRSESGDLRGRASITPPPPCRSRGWADVPASILAGCAVLQLGRKTFYYADFLLSWFLLVFFDVLIRKPLTTRTFWTPSGGVRCEKGYCHGFMDLRRAP